MTSKAFDSVSWSFLQATLNFFGFKENFCKWIKVLNTNIKAAILQCGTLSEFFSIERGCRQGDPIAPYLFLLCVQIMYLLIQNEKSIKGVYINQTEFKITQYADDTTLILNGSKESLLAALNVLECFGSMSGLEINTDKTKLIWIGKKRFSKEKIDVGKPLTWGETTFNLLGINFSVTLADMIQTNFSLAIKKLEHLFQVWNQRYLTPLGRITIVKTFALSKLNHLFLALPTPGM